MEPGYETCPASAATSVELYSYRSAMRSYRAVMLAFIAAELDLAKTFYELSVSTSDPRRARRNAMCARIAFATAQRFFSQGHLDTKTDAAVKAVRTNVQATGVIIARLNPSTDAAVA